jgi:peptidoglycan hydrolase-like protein with peptidoglycan-binding domain
VDGNISYNIVIDAATSSDVSYNGINPADVSVTNDDNDSALSSEKDINTFSFVSPSVTGSISGTDINLTVPYGTSVTSLVSNFTTTGASISVGAINQINGVTSNNFTSPVTYTVNAEDSSTKNYIVTVSIAARSGGRGRSISRQNTVIATIPPVVVIVPPVVDVVPTIDPILLIPDATPEIVSPVVSVYIPKNFTKNLTIGNVDKEVQELQKFLNSKGYFVAKTGLGSFGNETNTFGLATKAALIKFQEANQIFPAEGYFGPKTRAVINTINLENQLESKILNPIFPQKDSVISVDVKKTIDGDALIYKRDLKFGMSGSDVSLLQQFLITQNVGPNANSLKEGGATGYFGIKTKLALIEYQQKNGIYPSEGYFGSKTRSHIKN